MIGYFTFSSTKISLIHQKSKLIHLFSNFHSPPHNFIITDPPLKTPSQSNNILINNSSEFSVANLFHHSRSSYSKTLRRKRNFDLLISDANAPGSCQNLPRFPTLTNSSSSQPTRYSDVIIPAVPTPKTLTFSNKNILNFNLARSPFLSKLVLPPSPKTSPRSRKTPIFLPSSPANITTTPATSQSISPRSLFSPSRLVEILDKMAGKSPFSLVELTEMVFSIISADHSLDQLSQELLSVFGVDHFESISFLTRHSGEILKLLKVSSILLSNLSLSRDAIIGFISNPTEFTKISKISKSKGQLKRDNRNSRLQEAHAPSTKSIDYYQSKVQDQTHDDPDPDSSPGFLTMADYIALQESLVPLNAEKIIDPINPSIESWVIPAPNPENNPTRKIARLLIAETFPTWAHPVFRGMESLNPMQSKVFPVAFNSSENILISAPTGAGKTNVALTCVLRTIQSHWNEQFNRLNRPSDILAAASGSSMFKIIYVAPMKALASEVVSKFKAKLGCLGISVEELTGDMHLTKAVIAKTHVIVTTPEKWDVITRKSSTAGNDSFASQIELLILDEVHLLEDERGAVLEALVARTLRQVEFTQRLIRIVGLSATLPNYRDVAEFLRVSSTGLFHFDQQQARPVPLQQTLVGINSQKIYQVNQLMNQVTWKKVSEMVSNGHQVLVFVHSRRETVKTARFLMSQASKFQLRHLFSIGRTTSSESPNVPLTSDNKPLRLPTSYQQAKFSKLLNASKHPDIRELSLGGFSVHHSGMLRKDRDLTQDLFLSGYVRVLCCTASLAWGVNLPSRCVVIKGSQIYDSEHGEFRPCSILDIHQIFGRAGRPQFDDQGDATLIVSKYEHLSHFLRLLARQRPINSHFEPEIINHLNAEVVSGTVDSISAAETWLSYTYYHVRQSGGYKGVSSGAIASHLSTCLTSAKLLSHLGMVKYNPKIHTLAPTNLGRIASHFYLSHQTVSHLNKKLRSTATNEELLSIICESYEFHDMRVREEEIRELCNVYELLPIQISDMGAIRESISFAGGVEPSENSSSNDSNRVHTKISVVKDSESESKPKAEMDTPIKVNILLQSYISRIPFKTFTLSSDQSYVAQNAIRIVRALFELALSRSWFNVSFHLHNLVLELELRVWRDSHFLTQFCPSILSWNALRKVDGSKRLNLGSGDLFTMWKSAAPRNPNSFSNPKSKSKNLFNGEEDILSTINKQKFTATESSSFSKFKSTKQIQIKQSLFNKQVSVMTNSLTSMLRDKRDSARIVGAWSFLPRLSIKKQKVEPITSSILRLLLQVEADFSWNDRLHKSHQPFHIWIESRGQILHSEYFILEKTQRFDTHSLSFILPYVTTDTEISPPEFYVMHIKSDRFFMNEYSLFRNDTSSQLGVFYIPLNNISLPQEETYYTPLHKLVPLKLEKVFSNSPPALNFFTSKGFKYFNPCQTQFFHAAFHSNENLLIGAPTGSGKTVAAELAILQSLILNPNSLIVYVAPLKALVHERIRDWKKRFTKYIRDSTTGNRNLNHIVTELSGDFAPDMNILKTSNIICTTPEKWDSVSRAWKKKNYVQRVSCLIFDEIHLLGSDRGPIIEVIVSRSRFISAQTGTNLRIVALSTALANAVDVSRWLGVDVDTGLFNFPHSVRPIPIQSFIHGVPPSKAFCALHSTMNPIVHNAILNHSPRKSVLIFVSSRRQTRLTANALIQKNQSQLSWVNFENFSRLLLGDSKRANVRNSKKTNSKNTGKNDSSSTGFSKWLEQRIRDPILRHCLEFGVGLHHAGLQKSDKHVVEALFSASVIQILIATATLAWGVNLPAHFVIVKGVQYFDPETKKYLDYTITDVLQMVGRAGRFNSQVSIEEQNAKALLVVQHPKKNYYKRFLHSPFPVESSLPHSLDDNLLAEIVLSTIHSPQQAIEYLSWTFLFQRLSKNPSFYGITFDSTKSKLEVVTEWLSDLVADSLGKLVASGCISVSSTAPLENGMVPLSDPKSLRLHPTPLGKLATFYYLSHMTVYTFSLFLSSDSDFKSIIQVIALSHEFEGVPVRHNEDKQNAELLDSLTFRYSGSKDLLPSYFIMKSPHTKTILLFYAHFSRVQMPISDYITDLRLVLDSSIRIIQASIDHCSINGWLKPTLDAIHVHQSIISGAWKQKNNLLALPHINDFNLESFIQGAKILDINAMKKCKPNTLIRWLKISLKWSWSKIADLIYVLANYDRKKFTISVTSVGETTVTANILIQTLSDRWKRVLEKPKGKPTDEFSILSVLQKCPKRYKPPVQLSGPNRKAYAPTYPKPMDKGYWIIIGEPKTNTLFTITRIKGDRRNTKLEWNIPKSLILDALEKNRNQSEQIWNLVLYCKSEVFIGVDPNPVEFSISLPIYTLASRVFQNYQNPVNQRSTLDLELENFPIRASNSNVPKPQMVQLDISDDDIPGGKS